MVLHILCSVLSYLCDTCVIHVMRVVMMREIERRGEGEQESFCVWGVKA